MRAGVSRWLVLVLIAGCGGDGLDLVPVEGIVTFNGQPVADGGATSARSTVSNRPIQAAPIFAMRDGSVQFLGETIDIVNYNRLGGQADGQTAVIE